MFCNFCRILERAFMAGHEDVPFAVSFRDNSCNFWHSCYAWTRLSLHSKCSPPLFLTFASSNPIPRLPALALIPSPLLEGPLVYHSTLTMQQAVISLSKNMTKLCTDTTENPCSKWGYAVMHLGPMWSDHLYTKKRRWHFCDPKAPRSFEISTRNLREVVGLGQTKAL